MRTDVDVEEQGEVVMDDDNPKSGGGSVVAQTDEEELRLLVEQGEWELIIKTEAFVKRNIESQAQLVSEAIEIRTAKMRKEFARLINKGPRFRAGAMGVIQRVGELEAIRDEIMREVYEKHPRSISEIAGVEIDYY